MDNELRREIILDNYNDPMNKGLINDDSYLKANTKSDSCIDDLDFQMKVEDGKIVDIHFDGEACAISTSASSIMIRKLIGKSIEEVKSILENYINMIDGKDFDKELIGELIVYDDISKQPNRRNCALLPTVAFRKMLDELNK